MRLNQIWKTQLKDGADYMEHDKQPTNPKKTKSIFSWLFWWQLDSDELNKQVAEYKTLKFYQSARGMSLICLLFSVAITGLFIFLNTIDISALIDIFIFLILGFFIYRGHKWAIIGAMIIWTLEKVFQVVQLVQLHNFNPILPLIWWAIYMHAFYLALRVERLRSQNLKAKND